MQRDNNLQHHMESRCGAEQANDINVSLRDGNDSWSLISIAQCWWFFKLKWILPNCSLFVSKCERLKRGLQIHKKCTFTHNRLTWKGIGYNLLTTCTKWHEGNLNRKQTCISIHMGILRLFMYNISKCISVQPGLGNAKTGPQARDQFCCD